VKGTRDMGSDISSTRTEDGMIENLFFLTLCTTVPLSSLTLRTLGVFREHRQQKRAVGGPVLGGTGPPWPAPCPSPPLSAGFSSPEIARTTPSCKPTERMYRGHATELSSPSSCGITELSSSS